MVQVERTVNAKLSTAAMIHRPACDRAARYPNFNAVFLVKLKNQ